MALDFWQLGAGVVIGTGHCFAFTRSGTWRKVRNQTAARLYAYGAGITGAGLLVLLLQELGPLGTFYALMGWAMVIFGIAFWRNWAKAASENAEADGKADIRSA